MLQEFIKEIHGLYPRLKPQAIYKIFCGMKGRNKKYNIFGLGKRDGFRFNISERQMQNFINLMMDYGLLKISGEVKGNRGYTCRIFKASNTLLKYFVQIKSTIIVKSFNISDRIRDWNNKGVSYISELFTITSIHNKRSFMYTGTKYIIGKGKYNGYVYDTDNDKGITIFNFIDSIGENNIYKTALKLNIL